MRQAGLYRTEIAGSPESGDLTLAQVQSLRDPMAPQDRLQARGVDLVDRGPDASHRAGRRRVGRVSLATLRAARLASGARRTETGSFPERATRDCISCSCDPLA